MRNIENIYLRKIDTDLAYKEAITLLARESIQPRDFIDLYGEENVAKDEELVKKLEMEFAKNNIGNEEILKLATTFEAIFHYNIKRNEWLGPNVYPIKPSRYDDIVNGVDEIAELREKEETAQYLALAIDLTFSPSKEKVFERIKNEIKNGSLATIKYFHSKYLGIRGEKSGIPRVVIGVSAKTVRELSDLWLDEENQNLARHPVQFQILEEILLQLETFENYAQKVKQPQAAASYQKIRRLIESIYKEKKKKIPDSGIRDDVYDAIRNNLKYFLS